tara:strand:+ start:4315 stop:7062 length:2748 start_codon:yes stop_codon:yes gene_type:complete
MSIKTIGQSTQSNTRGLEKIINKGAERLVIDVLQSTQYSTPIPSTIRELVTNACDSQREKEIAIEILTGKAEASEYFITREGAEYEDSNFDPSYYNLEHLDMDQHRVKVLYIENDEGTGYCDTVEIIDYGVGIGGRRLEGMLELGYSTKRNTAENFGAFGLGSKIALSTGVSHYTIETVYNGKLFKMHCYPYKTDFAISKWDADGEITLSNGDPAYYKATTHKNYTKISFGSKKHNRRAFNNAVRDQLSYIHNVDFFTQYASGGMFPEHISKNILINTPTCIVSEGSSWYTKPHIVIVKNPGDSIGINYGSIDFREMEMEDLHGNIGIKCPMRQAYIDDDGNEVVVREGVEVTPSREKVIYNDKTKEYLQKMLQRAADEAGELIEEALKEEDFLKWIELCSNVLYKNSSSEEVSNDLMGLNQIARMVDTSTIRPMFKSSGIRYANPKKMLPGYRVRVITKNYNTINRADLDNWSSGNLSRIYYAEDGGASKMKDLYLTGEGGGFVLITPIDKDFLADEIFKETRPEQKAKLIAAKTKHDNLKQVIAQLLDQHSPSLLSYDEIVVPDDVQLMLSKIEEREQTKQLSAAELRKLQQRTVGYTLRLNRREEKWVWDKVEPKIEQVLNSTVPTFYGTREDEMKLKLAAAILKPRVPTWFQKGTHADGDWERSPVLFHEVGPSNAWSPSKYNPEEGQVIDHNSPQIIRMSEANTRHARKNTNWKHVDDFFFTMDEEGNITVTEYLKAALTGMYLRKNRKSVWMWLGNRVARELLPPANKLYRTIDRYIQTTWFQPERDQETQEFLSYLENFIEYQDICDDGDVSLRQQASRSFFVVDVPSIDAYDREIANVCSVLNDLSETIGDWMLECNPSGSHSNLEVYKFVLEGYNKFDIDIPEVEVPRMRFGFTPQELIKTDNGEH